MILTLQITDEQFSRLKKALQIAYSDYRTFYHLDKEESNPKITELVEKILCARLALDLSTSQTEVCPDVPPPKYDVIDSR